MARSIDSEGLLRLWLDLVEYHRRLDPEFPALPSLRAVLLREIERGLRSSECCLGVAEFGSELVGFVFAGLKASAQARRGEGGGWIHELYVDPAWRRHGVATALLEIAGDFFGQRGAGRISVRVESANEDGLRFWLRSGFLERERILTR